MNNLKCLVLFFFINKVSGDFLLPTPGPNPSTTPRHSYSIQPGQDIQPQSQMQDIGRCNYTSLEICVDVLRKGPLGGDIFSVNDTIISSLALACSQLATVKTCMAENGKNCFFYDLLQYTQFIDSINYICNVNKIGFVYLKTCLSDKTKANEVTLNFSKCYANVNASTPVNFVTGPVLGQFCKQNNGFYSCYVNASKVCDSTDFMINYYKISQGQVMTSNYLCNFNYLNWDTQVYSECNIHKFRQCFADQTFFFNPFDESKNKSYVLDLSTFCKSVADAPSCVANYAKCQDGENIYAVSTLKANTYLCNDGRTGYNKLVQCLETNKYLFESCVFVYSFDCARFNTLHACMVDSAKKFCGDGTFVQNFIYESLKPYSKLLNCSLNLPFIKATNNLNTGVQLGSQWLPVFVFLVVAFLISK